MLTLSKIERSKDATQYYAQDNYYSQKETVDQSEWIGSGIEDLNLSGEVDPVLFQKMLDGQLEGQQLGRIEKGEHKHIAGYDLTLSAPKSVSILTEVLNNAEVRLAHKQAVKETLEFIEKNYIETRLHINKKTQVMASDNAIFATFTHDVSRELDPQLHTHCILINATKVNGEYKSLTAGQLYKKQKVMGQLYRQNLANRLKKLGYGLTRNEQDKTLFELADVPLDMINEFSQRRNQILQYFEVNNIEYDPVLAKQIALKTRRKKTAVDRKELLKKWHQKAQKYNVNIKKYKTKSLSAGSEKTFLEYAINHLSERSASFSEEELFKTSLEFKSDLNPAKLLNAIKSKISKGTLLLAPKHPDKQKTDTLYTTPGLMETENNIVAHIQKSVNQVQAIGKEHSIKTVLNKTHLNEQQKQAVIGSLQSTNRVYGIQGDAGVGKTTLLAEYKKILKNEGYEVLAMAPSYQAVTELTSSLKIEGMVVDRFLVDESLHNKRPGKVNKMVWIVDETSMLDSIKVDEMLKAAEQQNARVLFVGDHKQLESVGAGRAFKQLQESGMDYSVVDKRMRQKNTAMKTLVQKTIDQDFDGVIDTLKENEFIKNKSHDELLQSTAKSWLELDDKARSETVIIAPSNDQRKSIDIEIRRELIKSKKISPDLMNKNVLVDKYTTNQQKKMAGNYKIGDVVRFEKKHLSKAGGKNNSIESGEYFTVKGVADKQLILKAERGNRIIKINPANYIDRKGGIQQYTKESLSLGSGDNVKWMDNKNKLGLKRNTKLTVERISKNFIRLRDDLTGKSHKVDTGDKTLLHIGHNYSKTAYAVQGETVKHAIVLADSQRINTLNRKSFLVAVTRASEKVTVFTDDSYKLKKALNGRSGKNTVATQTVTQKIRLMPIL